MATLSGNKIKDTYQSLIKLTDNGNLTTGAKQLTDGFGNNSPLYISTTQIGIGVTPEATYDLHVYSNAKVGGNLTVTGDLTVEGTTTTIDTQTLTVEDPLIEVASNNTSTDAVDIGWYGKYAPSGTVLYAGLFRDTGDSKFKLFRNLEEQPTTTVNTSGTGYTKAGLVIGNLEATQVDLGDNEKIRFGASQDLEIYHNGTSASIRNNTGDILISALEADSNIKFYTDNGVGTTVSNLEISGSTGTVSLKYYGSQKLYTTNTGISVTGRISQLTDPSAAQDAATKAYVDAQIGANNELSEVLANGNTTGGTDIEVSAGDNIDFADGSSARFGAGLDLKIQHNGTNSLIDNEVGDFYIRQEANDQDLIFQADDGSGGNATYFELDGSSQINKFYQHTRTIDNKYLGAGSSLDMYMFHDGTNSFIRNGTGNLTIEQQVDDGDLIFKSDNGSGGVTTYMFLDGSAVNTRFFKDAKFSDNVKAIFGGSNDLEIYHDGSNSYISDTGTGNLFITGASNIYLQNGSNETYLDTTTNGAVRLYHDNSLKFETTSTGVNVTGGINTSGDFINVGNGQGNSENYLQLGHSRTGNGYAYVDFVGDTTYSDFGLRIIRGNSGANATSTIEHRGTGNFDIKTTEAANLRLQTANTTAITIDSSRQIQFNEYGSGTFTGTATYRLAVDSSGDVIEIPIGDGAVDGSGTANYVTKWSDTDTITNSVIYDNGTNVGIGTTTIGARLEVAASATTSVDIAHFSNSNSVQKAIFKLSGVGAGQLVLRDAGNNEDVLISSDGDSFFNGGSVGIGTSSPSSKLHIKQSVDTIDGGLTWESVDGTQEWSIDANNAGNFRIYKGTTAIARFDSSGNFGIGTTSPLRKLVVSGAADGIIQSNDTAGAGSFLRILADVTAENLINWDKDTDLRFCTSDEGFGNFSERMRIDSSGRVGIGTSSPVSTLEIAKNDQTNGAILSITNSFDGSDWTSGDTIGTINFRIDDASNTQKVRGQIKVFDDSATGSSYPPYNAMSFSTANGSSLSERMRIDSSGNVGINETSLTEKLEVNGAIVWKGALTTSKTSAGVLDRSGNDLRIRAYGATSGTGNLVFRTGGGGGSVDSEAMRIDSSGSVGIGTSSPDGKLKVVSGSSPNAAQILIGYNSTSENYFDANTQIFRNGSYAEKMRIDSSGNVGLGETNPSSYGKLVIKNDTSSGAGSSNASSIWLLNSNTTANNASSIFFGDNGTTAAGAINFINTDHTNEYGEISFDTRGSGGYGERMRIASDGNVAIGGAITSYSNYRYLTITGGSTSQGGVIYLKTSDSSVVGEMYVETAGMYISSSTSSKPMYLRAGGSDRLTILSSGNVGIGETSPNAKLEVYGNAQSDTTSIANSAAYIRGADVGIAIGQSASPPYGTWIQSQRNTDGVNFPLSLNPSGSNVGIGTTSPSTKLHISGGDSAIRITPTGGNDPRIDFTDSGGTVRFYTGYDVSSGNFVVTSDESGFGSSNIMVMSDAGNVGISTDSPTALLEINVPSVTTGSTSMLRLSRNKAVGYGTSEFKQYYNSSSDYGLRIGNTVSDFVTLNQSNGNVGIGTTSPDCKLDVNGIISPRGNQIRLAGGTDANHFLQKVTTGYSGGTIDGPMLQGHQGGELTTNYGGNNWALRWATGGEVYMNGDVGIGTTSPAYKLDVTGSISLGGSGSGLRFANGGATVTFIDENWGMQFNGDATHPVKISNASLEIGYSSAGANRGTGNLLVSGNVGIGTDSPSASLEISSPNTSGHISLWLNNSSTPDHGNVLAIARRGTDFTLNDSSLVMYCKQNSFGSYEAAHFRARGYKFQKHDGTDYLAINDSGYVGIRETSPNSYLYVKGTSSVVAGRFWGEAGTVAPLELAQNSGGGYLAKFYSDTFSTVCGSISHSGSATAFNTSSDYRLKENVVEMTGALDRVEQLKPSRFNFIGHDEIVDGFLAHEVSDIVPEAITGEKDEVDAEGNPVYQGIDQSKLVPLLVGAIQELKAEIETLKAQINN